jgi:hypothetical protein
VQNEVRELVLEEKKDVKMEKDLSYNSYGIHIQNHFLHMIEKQPLQEWLIIFLIHILQELKHANNATNIYIR